MSNRMLLFLFVISSLWCCNARDLTVLQSNDKLIEREVQHVEEVSKNENLCTLCEQFASEALDYLQQNKTQFEIISILHKSCSKIPSFTQQVSSIQAEGFCRKVDLCEDSGSFSRPVSKDKCDVCHNFVSEALLKLKDPDTELEIVELLLKACNSIGKKVQKCKRLVFEYAPIVLINAQQFLETNDICTILHACSSDSPLHAAS